MSVRLMIDAKIKTGAIVFGVIAALALPAAAHASNELAISQVPSAKVVNAGGAVSFTITVTNQGSEAYESVFAEVSSLGGHGLGANNPYQSFSSSQGACKDISGPCEVRKSDRAEKDALTSDWWFSRTLVRKPQRPCLPPSLAIRSGGLRSAQTHAWR